MKYLRLALSALPAMLLIAGAYESGKLVGRGEAKPASTLIGISRFAIEGMLIEIEAVAVAR